MTWNFSGYSKYRSIRTTIDGHTFPSRAEADRYCELRMLQQAGEISNLELQPKFILQEGFEYQGKKEKPITYVSDFRYKDKTGKEIVEDVKGLRTDVYKIKRKLLLAKYKHINFIET